MAKLTMTGTVKWFSDQRGFGFIKPDAPDQQEVFVHYSAIQMEGRRTLPQGAAVEYEVEQDAQGRRQAMYARILDGGR